MRNVATLALLVLLLSACAKEPAVVVVDDSAAAAQRAETVQKIRESKYIQLKPLGAKQDSASSELDLAELRRLAAEATAACAKGDTTQCTRADTLRTAAQDEATRQFTSVPLKESKSKAF